MTTTNKVDLSLHATNLKHIGVLCSKAMDLYAVVTHVSTQSGMKPVVLGTTEVIANTSSPHWVSVIVLEYQLGTPMIVAVQIYDQKHKQQPVGTVTFDVGECLGTRGNTKAKKMKQGGTVYAHASKHQGSGTMTLQMKGIQLKNVEGFMRKSDPFFELSCKRDAAGGLTWDNVFRSNVILDNLNPVWESANIELSTLCQGDLDKPILVSVFDFESNGKHVPMGQFQTTVKGLQLAANTPFLLKQKGKEVGKIMVTKAEVFGVVTPSMEKTTDMSLPLFPPSKPTFIDYVSGGCEFNVVVAIDFTGSNGEIHHPSSLHYIHKDGKLNDYEKAINAIVSILAKYDSDQVFPVYGFGADFGRDVDHCFQVGPTEEVHGVRAILDAYHHTLHSRFQLSGPTDFSEVVQTAASRAVSQQEAAMAAGKQAYSVLLIVTDGAVTNVQKNANVMKQCSNAPLSIVIVGVGNADFSSMRFLDDKAQPQGVPDIVQFVPFNAHCKSSVDLSSATLQEIPQQLVNYFQRNGIQPLAPIQPTDEDIVVEMEEEEIDLSLNFSDNGSIAVASGGVRTIDGFRTQ